MDYNVLENFIDRYSEERLYEFIEWLNEGKSYVWIARVLHVSPSRVCRLANRLFDHKWGLTDTTVLLLKHRHEVRDWENQDRKRELAEHSNLIPFDASSHR